MDKKAIREAMDQVLMADLKLGNIFLIEKMAEHREGKAVFMKDFQLAMCELGMSISELKLLLRKQGVIEPHG